ncbi:uncharacterized protein LOC130130078 [Lampris incognitus]|uniref:uncharacterized protein LOC130130078 n=1 Tax=Lampris incognitus TaxID=2546036 RepID=UPI0024B5F39B|nr:uncharacterized protein LOC130130078 [Lampris incognitus]
MASQMFLHPENRGENCRHVMIHTLSVALALVSQLFSEVFGGLAADFHVPNALFKASARNVSETFSLEVTMDQWAENFWIMSHIWSTAWLLQAAINLFRRNVLGPVSCNPEIHPPLFYLMWAIINTARICGMFLWSKHDLLGVLFLKWLLPVYSFYMLHMSSCNLSKHRVWLAINNPSETWWIRYLTQNGLALFATWTLLEANITLGIVFKYRAGLQDPMASSVVLTVLLLCMIIWFVYERFLFINHIRYTFCVYPTLILGLGAMFTRSYRVNDLSTNTIFCGSLMLLATLLSCVHLSSLCCFIQKPPTFRGQQEPCVRCEACETVCRPESMMDTKATSDINKKVIYKI